MSPWNPSCVNRPWKRRESKMEKSNRANRKKKNEERWERKHASDKKLMGLIRVRVWNLVQIQIKIWIIQIYFHEGDCFSFYKWKFFTKYWVTQYPVPQVRWRLLTGKITGGWSSCWRLQFVLLLNWKEICIILSTPFISMRAGYRKETQPVIMHYSSTATQTAASNNREWTS